jgi:hypothetical protein
MADRHAAAFRSLLRLNIYMENTAYWSTNRYGTSWRQMTMFFDWRDQDLVEEAIETINPLKLTVRSHVIAIGSAFGDGRLALRQLVGMMQADDGSCIIIHPCRYPELFSHQQAGLGDDEGWFHVVGLARLDLADQKTYGSLMTALAERHGQFVGEMPCIDFYPPHSQTNGSLKRLGPK